MTQPALRPFVQQRWACHQCGYFESWTAKPLKIVTCVQCKQPAESMGGENCSGVTARDLPFFTKPRGGVKTFEAEYTFSERATSIQRRKRN